jgi:hypothetical protein
LDSRYIASGRPQQKTPLPLLYPNNTWILKCLSVPAGSCLPSRCPVLNVYSRYDIPDFRRHVTASCYRL